MPLNGGRSSRSWGSRRSDPCPNTRLLNCSNSTQGDIPMEKMLHSAAIFVIGVAVGSLTIPALSQQVRTLKTTRLMTTDLAGFCDGKEVVVDYSEVEPGA